MPTIGIIIEKKRANVRMGTYILIKLKTFKTKEILTMWMVLLANGNKPSSSKQNIPQTQIRLMIRS